MQSCTYFVTGMQAWLLSAAAMYHTSAGNSREAYLSQSYGLRDCTSLLGCRRCAELSLPSALAVEVLPTVNAALPDEDAGPAVVTGAALVCDATPCWCAVVLSGAAATVGAATAWEDAASLAAAAAVWVAGGMHSAAAVSMAAWVPGTATIPVSAAAPAAAVHTVVAEVSDAAAAATRVAVAAAAAAATVSAATSDDAVVLGTADMESNADGM